MPTLMLDFQDNRRRAGPVDIGLLVVSLILATASLIAAAYLFSTIRALETQQALRHRVTTVANTGADGSAIDARHLRSELTQANSVVGLLSLPWDALFSDIEASQNAQVALLAVAPDPDKRTLMITAEAKDFNAMLSYMRVLQTRPSIKEVYLKSHTIDLKSAERPVRFVLSASWVLQP